MPLVRQTVAMLPVCVLPEATFLLSGAIWCFEDQSVRPKEHGSLSELEGLRTLPSRAPITNENELVAYVTFRCRKDNELQPHKGHNSKLKVKFN